MFSDEFSNKRNRFSNKSNVLALERRPVRTLEPAHAVRRAQDDPLLKLAPVLRFLGLGGARPGSFCARRALRTSVSSLLTQVRP